MLSVVTPFPALVGWSLAVRDMQMHPCFAHLGGLYRVVGALEIGALLGLQQLPVLAAVLHVVCALLGYLLCLSLVFAPSETGANLVAVEWSAIPPRPVDGADWLLYSFATMCTWGLSHTALAD